MKRDGINDGKSGKRAEKVLLFLILYWSYIKYVMQFPLSADLTYYKFRSTLLGGQTDINPYFRKLHLINIKYKGEIICVY